MKTKSAFLIVISTVLISVGCAHKSSLDLKMTIEPKSDNNSILFYNFGETGRIIKNRLINYGIDSENITLETFTDRMVLNIAKADTSKIEVINKLITVQGKIGFYETYENSELFNSILEANNRLRDYKVNKEDVIEESAAKVISKDTIKDEDSKITDLLNADSANIENQGINDLLKEDTTGAAAQKEYKINNPLFAILMPNVDPEGKPGQSCKIGLAEGKDTAKVIKYLNMKWINTLFPRDLKLYWSRDPHNLDETKQIYELLAIKDNSYSGIAPLDGSSITEAKAVTNKSGFNPSVSISMNAEGAKIWANMTHVNINRCIAVVIDGIVRSYPRVMAEIKGGNSEISANFSLTEAQYLAAVLSSGGKVLPLKLKVSDTQIIKEK